MLVHGDDACSAQLQKKNALWQKKDQREIGGFIQKGQKVQERKGKRERVRKRKEAEEGWRRWWQWIQGSGVGGELEGLCNGDEIAPSLASEIAKSHNSSQLRGYRNYYDC